MGLDGLDKNKILVAGVSKVLSVMPLSPFMQIYLRSVEGFVRRQERNGGGRYAGGSSHIHPPADTVESVFDGQEA